MNALSYMSWIGNNDGEGYLGLNKNGLQIHKSVKKLKYEGVYYFLVSHQRFSTGGGNTDLNTHPHIFKDFILLHNGVFSGLGSDNKKSDTRLYAEELEKIYKKSKDMLKSIKTISKMVGGYYSCVVYEISTGKIYYYKENSSTIKKIENDDWLILSTAEENLDYAKYYLNIDEKIEDVVPFKIYDVFNDFSVVDKFQEREIPVFGTSFLKSYKKPKIELELSDDYQDKYRVVNDGEGEYYYDSIVGAWIKKGDVIDWIRGY